MKILGASHRLRTRSRWQGRIRYNKTENVAQIGRPKTRPKVKGRKSFPIPPLVWASRREGVVLLIAASASAAPDSTPRGRGP